MNRTIALLVAAAALVGAAASQGGWAQELTPAAYVEISLARLQMVRDDLTRDSRMPTRLEEGLLWQRYGTTAEAFYAYRSLNPAAVNDYLAAHPELAAQIEQLSTEIHSQADKLE